MRRKIKERKGQTMIEFLLVSPLLIYSLFLMLVIWDVCNNVIIANHAAYYFCRTFIVEESKELVDPLTAARNAAAGVMPSDWDKNDLKHESAGGSVSVDISYGYLLPKVLAFFTGEGDEYKIHGCCMMRKI